MAGIYDERIRYSAYLIGWNLEDIGYLYHLEQVGWGPIRISDMEIEGGNPEELRRELQKPSSFPAITEWR